MKNSIENKIIELPDNPGKIQLLKEGVEIAARYVADIEEIKEKDQTIVFDSKNTLPYMDLVVFSELLLNKRINTRELYQELEEEGIISSNEDFEKYQRVCNDLRYFCKNA